MTGHPPGSPFWPSFLLPSQTSFLWASLRVAIPWGFLLVSISSHSTYSLWVIASTLCLTYLCKLRIPKLYLQPWHFFWISGLNIQTSIGHLSFAFYKVPQKSTFLTPNPQSHLQIRFSSWSLVWKHPRPPYHQSSCKRGLQYEPLLGVRHVLFVFVRLERQVCLGNLFTQGITASLGKGLILREGEMDKSGWLEIAEYGKSDGRLQPHHTRKKKGMLRRDQGKQLWCWVGGWNFPGEAQKCQILKLCASSWRIFLDLPLSFDSSFGWLLTFLSHPLTLELVEYKKPDPSFSSLHVKQGCKLIVLHSSSASNNRVASATDKVGLPRLCSVSVPLAWSLQWKPMKDGIQGFRGVDPDDAEAQLRHTMMYLSSGPLFMCPLPHLSFSSLSLLTPLVLRDASQMFFWACFPDPCL